MNLPNKITLTRILMIPLFVAIFYLDVIPYCELIAGVIFVIAAATDALDGHVARSRNLVTNLGKFLDPIADKVLVSTAFIVLLTKPAAFVAVGEWGLIVAGILVALILARELIVSGFRMIAAGQKLVLAADKLGKLKTVCQDASIALLLVGTSLISLTAGKIIVYVGLVLFAACAVLTVVSGVNYIVKNKRVLQDQEEKTMEEEKIEQASAEEQEVAEVDEIYYEALGVVVEIGTASLSTLQRKCSIGYNRAGKIVEWMEANGYVEPFNGARARKVLLSQQAYEEIMKARKDGE